MEEITVEEWRAEIDMLRGTVCKGPKYKPYTDEQIKVLVYARSGARKVPWRTLSKYWVRRGWSIYGYGTKKLRREYDRAERLGLVDVEKLR